MNRLAGSDSKKVTAEIIAVFVSDITYCPIFQHLRSFPFLVKKIPLRLLVFCMPSLLLGVPNLLAYTVKRFIVALVIT